MCHFICCEIALGYVERNKTITSDMTTFGCCSFLTKCDTKKYGKKGVLSYITLSIKSFPYLKKTHGPLILPFGLQIRPCNCSPHPHGAAGLVSWSGLEVPGGGWDCTRVSGRGGLGCRTHSGQCSPPHTFTFTASL